MGLNYQQAIGKLICAYTLCQIEIAIAAIAFSQFLQHPVEIHYNDIKQVFVYLKATKAYALTYRQPEPKRDLPYKPGPC